MMNPEPAAQIESSALRSMIGGPIKPFLDDIWQNGCVLYSNKIGEVQSPSTCEPSFHLEQVQASPYHELLRNGWASLTQLLENSSQRYSSITSDNNCPILFLDKEIVSPELYNHSLYHAYLNGCSVVVNHADETCPYLAALCLDLQKSLPHAYANTYLTPPLSQAVPPHADDRDVFILQIYGRKRWQVYKNIPIPFPYPHEQVGKDDLIVPPHVLDSDCLVDRILQPGDVLYMPRGYVHQAQTVLDEPSYHVTVALATHDWTLAGLVTSTTMQTLHRNLSYRRALPLHLGQPRSTSNVTGDDVNALQMQLDELFKELQMKITSETVIENFAHRCETHNSRTLPLRQATINKAIMNASSITAVAQHDAGIIGPEAARQVKMSTRVRSATLEEKESLVILDGAPRGLHVREAIADTVMEILSRLKSVVGLTRRVGDLRDLVDSSKRSPLVCDLTLISFAKTCVALGALAIA